MAKRRKKWREPDWRGLAKLVWAVAGLIGAVGCSRLPCRIEEVAVLIFSVSGPNAFTLNGCARRGVAHGRTRRCRGLFLDSGAAIAPINHRRDEKQGRADNQP
jgi:hypothetical protein